MILKFSRAMSVMATCVIGTSVLAQESSNRVAANTDWSVFVEGSPKECWSVSAPKESENTRDGQTVSVRRGDVLLMISYHPQESVQGQVSFTGGYPFASGSTVSMEIGGATFQLFTEGEWAWAEPADDAKIVAAMKRGADTTLTARSGRGTQTADRFSLLGFTAAVAEAENRCK